MGQSELRNAFNAHSIASKNGTSTFHCLLLFYAVECGLKSIYYRKVNSSVIIEICDDKSGHDLLSWAKKLMLPPKIIMRDPKFKLRRDGETLEVTKAHEAWRYGALINLTLSQNTTKP